MGWGEAGASMIQYKRFLTCLWFAIFSVGFVLLVVVLFLFAVVGRWFSLFASGSIKNEANGRLPTANKK